MIRDGLLFVSGRLQSHDGGPSLPLDRKALRPGDLVNPPTLSGGFEVPDRIRDTRSIYQPVIRSFFHKSVDVLELFDTPSRITLSVSVSAQPYQLRLCICLIHHSSGNRPNNLHRTF